MIHNMDSNYVITIGRQWGSGGKEIGEKLATLLEIHFLDKKLIELASEHSGLCKEFFEKADEKTSKGIIGGLFGMRFPFITDGGVSPINCLSNDALFQVQSDVIRQVAATDSCLIVGRCSDYILRNHPRKIDVFITANHEDRVLRVQKRHSVTAEEAEALIEKMDKKRADYYNYYSYKLWGNAAGYHLCVNSSVLGIEGTVSFIADFINKRLAMQ